ncbi:MAG: hypothetical protein AAGI45_17835 [Cyanobacteria bacterium P01_H01_bin.26]
MVTKHTSTISLVYGTKDKSPRGATPLAKMLLGFRDSFESFRDWQRLRPWSRRYVDEQPIIRQTFFNLLGKPLCDADDYSAPWDDYWVSGGSVCVDTPAARQEMVGVALEERAGPG